MDDFNVASLSEAKSEYCIRLVNILTPLIMQGIRSIFTEANKLCIENNEESKYLMTFQNFLARVPKWNSAIVESETQRIVQESKCSYIEDLITCVHVAQLKILTSIRVGQKQKQIDIDIPRLDTFVHRIYISVARKVFSNVYLFEEMIPPLNYQKNMRECELIIKECILETIRDNMPIEHILRSYMGATVEEEVEEQLIDASEGEVADVSANVNPEAKPDPVVNAESTETTDTSGAPITPPEDTAPSSEPPESPLPPLQSLKFNDTDAVLDMDTNKETNVSAPKDIQRLEHISDIRNTERKQQDIEEDGLDRITIHTDTNVDLGAIDVHNVGDILRINEAPLLTDIEVLS
jgi:hypothetical protein